MILPGRHALHPSQHPQSRGRLLSCLDWNCWPSQRLQKSGQKEVLKVLCSGPVSFSCSWHKVFSHILHVQLYCILLWSTKKALCNLCCHVFPGSHANLHLRKAEWRLLSHASKWAGRLSKHTRAKVPKSVWFSPLFSTANSTPLHTHS
jgi:hypothetical protein